MIKTLCLNLNLLLKENYITTKKYSKENKLFPINIKYMKYFLLIFTIMLFPVLSVYAETNNVELLVVDGNEDQINPWGLHIEIYEQNNKEKPIMVLEQPPNPSYVSLENGVYSIKVYRHDMFVGYVTPTIDKSVDKVRIPILDLGGVLFQVRYNDNKPIQGALVEIFSHKGTKWAEDVTGNDGRTERFWLQIPSRINEYYSVKISLSDEVSYNISRFVFSKGYNDEVIITPWKSIVDDRTKIQLFKNIRQPISNYDGTFIVELYDSNNEKIIETKTNSRGEASFSNLPVGFYFLRVLELPSDNFSEPTIWAIKRILIHNALNDIKIILEEEEFYRSSLDTNSKQIESPDETCNCVAFRLDNVQDFYLADVQKELINLFLRKQAPLTVGIIGKNFGSDTELINFLKTSLSEHKNLLSVSNHGGTTDITTSSEDEQLQLIDNTNNIIYNFLGEKPTVFIPPFGNYNKDTISALEKLNVKYISSVSSFDTDPYPFDNEEVLRFPSTASTGYIEQGRAWYGIPANQTMRDIKYSIRDYGFAVVLLHPHEYSKRSGWDFGNDIDITQYYELHELIDEVREFGLKIVLIENIDREALLFSGTSVPKWFKTTVSWWTDDKITDRDFIDSIEYLINKKIIRVPQVDIKITYYSEKVPLIFKNNAKLWIQEKISDKEFIDEVEVLVKQGIIKVRN